MPEYLTIESSPKGETDITAQSIVQVAYSGAGPKYPIATLNEIALATIKYCGWAKLRPSYVAGHMLLETGAFHYGGDVIPEQYNFGGIGTTGGGVQGLWFDTPDIGVQAMVAHECGYIYGALDNWPEEARSLYQSNPRTRFVVYGPNAASVQVIGDLGSGKWAASPSSTYCPALVFWGNRTIEVSDGEIAPPIDTGSESVIDIVDIRDQLRINASGGPDYQSARKVGIVLHYNGPPPNSDAYIQYINDANYHCNMDWGNGSRGDGIMYHYGIQSGDEGKYPDGTIFLLRDENDVLWHCASWIPGGNESGIAININIGQGQHASKRAIASAFALFIDISYRRNISRDMVKGHNELSSTACPGTLMDDVVIPYRLGEDAGTVPPVEADHFIHENGYIIGGGIKAIIDSLESVNHSFRMRMAGYAISDEGNGYLLMPETDGSGNLSGRFMAETVVLQKFERTTFMHQPSQPIGEWQDTAPLLNMGYLVGFESDAIIQEIISNPLWMISEPTDNLPEHQS